MVDKFRIEKEFEGFLGTWLWTICIIGFGIIAVLFAIMLGWL